MEREIDFKLNPRWKNVGNPWYRPITNQQILKNVIIVSEDEKTRHELMINLLKQMEKKLPPFSALFINLNPDFEDSEGGEFFSKKYVYGSPDFSVPYYLDVGDDLFDMFTTYFTAILDFHPELSYTVGIMYRKYKEKDPFPTTMSGFLGSMKRYIQERGGEQEFTESLLRNIEEGILLFESDEVLEHAFKTTSSLPDWVSLWQNKKKIWLDLSQCEARNQQMLVAGIFYILLKVTNYPSIGNYHHLNGVVMINDTLNVFKPVPWKRYAARYNERREYWEELVENCYFLTKEQWVNAYGDKKFFIKSQLGTYYDKLISDELRYRNISLFTGIHDLKAIHKRIPQQSQVRIVPHSKPKI